jgi:hypothetical protein
MLTNSEVEAPSSGAGSATSTISRTGFRSAANPAVSSSGAVVAANPLGTGLMGNGMNPITIQLDCNPTAINDRFVTFVIKGLTFVGPPQLTGFP